MKTTEMLKQIKTMLKSRLGLAQMTLEDGETIIESDNFREGEAIFIVSDDERIALPIGEYRINENGGMIIVTEEGTIAEMRDDMAEKKMAQDGKKIKEEELDEVVVEDVPEVAVDEIAAIVDAVVEVIAPMITEVKEELKKYMETIPQAEEEGYRDGIDDEKEDERQKMSKQKPARKPMKHNPETSTRKAAQTLYSQNAGTHTTKDRVFNKLFN